jgi:hypothetical protein
MTFQSIMSDGSYYRDTLIAPVRFRVRVSRKLLAKAMRHDNHNEPYAMVLVETKGRAQ